MYFIHMACVCARAISANFNISFAHITLFSRYTKCTFRNRCICTFVLCYALRFVYGNLKFFPMKCFWKQNRTKIGIIKSNWVFPLISSKMTMRGNMSNDSFNPFRRATLNDRWIGTFESKWIYSCFSLFFYFKIEFHRIFFSSWSHAMINFILWFKIIIFNILQYSLIQHLLQPNENQFYKIPQKLFSQWVDKK